MTRWLIIVEGDIEPCLEGPFKREQMRVLAAQEHRRNDPMQRDGLFRVDISTSGRPRISSFTASEINSETGTGTEDSWTFHIGVKPRME